MPNQSNSTQQSPTSSQSDPDSKADILDEATTTSLEELMNRTPQITDMEADLIISYLRAQREKFAQQEATPKPKKTPRGKAPKPTLSVDELLAGMD